MKITHGGNVFSLARERGWDWRDVLDLSASINPLGPPAGVRQAIIDAMDRVTHYPDSSELVSCLARAWSVAESQVMAGNGATELLHFLARMWPQPQVTLAAPVFSEFHRAYPDAAIVPWECMGRWPREGLVVLTQPVNPTGRVVPFDRLRHWLLTSDHPVLIDESFLDFTDQPSAMTLLGERPNLLVLRSLTKFYALPGLRIGALAGDATILARLKERREPWQVNVLADAAARAALADADYAVRTRALIREERNWLLLELRRTQDAVPSLSEANYFSLYVPSAARLCEWLLDRRIILRNCSGWPGIHGETVRFAIRTRAENTRFMQALEECLCCS